MMLMWRGAGMLCVALTGGGKFWRGVSVAAWGLGLSSQHFLNSFSPMTMEAVARELQRHRSPNGD